MKKLLILAALVVAGITANAAAFNWNAANIYTTDLTTKYSGEITLYCSQLADWSVTATAVSGVVNKNNTAFTSDKFVVGNDYDFYFVITIDDKKFTSTTKSVGALDAQTANINFGNMAAATQNAGNWAAVPEPTSGLLMLLGVAGLALRRRRA